MEHLIGMWVLHFQESEQVKQYFRILHDIYLYKTFLWDKRVRSLWYSEYFYLFVYEIIQIQFFLKFCSWSVVYHLSFWSVFTSNRMTLSNSLSWRPINQFCNSLQPGKSSLLAAQNDRYIDIFETEMHKMWWFSMKIAQSRFKAYMIYKELQ